MSWFPPRQENRVCYFLLSTKDVSTYGTVNAVTKSSGEGNIKLPKFRSSIKALKRSDFWLFIGSILILPSFR
ncbi:hypothetical protein ACOSP7_000273 [Xanthoceras sorbifolium]